MDELISAREFAKREQVSHTLVNKAIRQGKLPVSGDNLIAASLVGTGWRKGNRRGKKGAEATALEGGNRTKKFPPKVSTAAQKVSTRKVFTPDDGPPLDEIEKGLFAEEANAFIDNVLAGRFVPVGDAEKIKENALAAKHLLAARKEAGSLVEIEVAEKILFDTQRAQRNAWLNFPSRIGPLLAAELGIEADMVLEALTAHVHDQLAKLGEPDPEFGGGSET
ncbi:MAG: hypothetical protein QM690_21670 [Sphingobium sp.]